MLYLDCVVPSSGGLFIHYIGLLSFDIHSIYVINTHLTHDYFLNINTNSRGFVRSCSSLYHNIRSYQSSYILINFIVYLVLLCIVSQ